MRVVAHHTLRELERDANAIPKKAAVGIAKAVRDSTTLGTRRAQMFARKASGPHGKNFYKRITGEMLSATEGEFGVTEGGGGLPVGGGFRHGVNRDLDRAAPIAVERLERDIERLVGRLFW